jgi:hypothetical protein
MQYDVSAYEREYKEEPITDKKNCTEFNSN